MTKRYRFRLATVLQLRVAEREQRRMALSAANIQLARAVAERDALLARRRATPPGKGPQSLDAFLAEEHRAQLLAAQAQEAQRRVGTLAREAALAQVAWAEASGRVTALERLDERRRAEHAREVARAELATVDDLVTARFVAEAERRRSSPARSSGFT